MGRNRDPYAPRGQHQEAFTAPEPGQLPIGRLRRLAVGEHIVAWLAATWASLPADVRAEEAERMAALPDADLVDAIVENAPPQGEAEVRTWVTEHPAPEAAARFALAVEEAQPHPRDELVDDLRATAG